MVAIVSRTTWGARAPKAIYRMRLPVAETWIHHTADAGPPSPTLDGEARFMRATQDFHMNTRGWNDIAYSYMIMPSGNIYEGRGWGVVGAHTENHNSISHAICFAGNYQNMMPSSVALLSAAQLIRQGMNQGFVKPGTHPSGGHRDVAATACPGGNLYARIPYLRELVAVSTPPPSEPTIVKPSYNPPLALRPIVSSTKAPNGGVWLLADDGSIYAFGGATYLGSPNGQPYWGTRKAALLQPYNNGYVITATSGETYHYPGG